MVTLALAACGAGTPSATTVEGVQVVAIETAPAQPSLGDQLRLRTWVADGRGYGADVLVWMCTPVDGACLEAHPPGTNGLPLQLWTFSGTADPVLDVTTAWPALVELALALVGPAPPPVADTADEPPTTSTNGTPGGTFDPPVEAVAGLVVWALACVPGACPIVDAVRADPVAGSEAWDAVVHDLANPAEWLAEVPPGEASLAVKTVPFFDPDAITATIGTTGPVVANRPPTILPRDGRTGRTAALLEFEVSDPDAEDELHLRAFTTAGAVEVSESSSLTGTTTGAGDRWWLTWRGPADREPADLFLVAEDGLGGTAVWSSAADVGTCGDPAEIVPHQASGAKIDPAEGLLLDTAYGGSFRVSGRLTGFRAPPAELTLRVVVDGVAQAVGAAPLASFDRERCSGWFEDALITLPPGSANALETVCALGGRLATLIVHDPETQTQAEVQVVIQLDPAWPCLF